MEALDAAEAVIALTAYKSASLQQVADILLPLSIYAENEGSIINVEGRLQSFAACVPGPGEARPGWKVLRVLANKLGMTDCNHHNVNGITDDISEQIAAVSFDNFADWAQPDTLSAGDNDLARISDVPMNSLDPLVRRAVALQQTNDIADGLVHINQVLAGRLGLNGGERVRLEQQGVRGDFGYVIDNRLPDNTVLIHAAHPDTATLGGWYDEISLQKA